MPNKPQTAALLLQAGRTVLAAVYDAETAAREARLLLASVWPAAKKPLLLLADLPITAEGEQVYRQMLARRLAGEPLQYITGHQEFMSLDFMVNPAVLVPRWDTEVLVETCLELMADIAQPAVLEIGTGSGAIAVSLAHCLPQANIAACDISPDALAVAERNAVSLGVAERVRFFLSDQFAALSPSQTQFHSIVSNPPYLTAAEMTALTPDLEREPALALYGGPDGLDFYRYFAALAADYLLPGGYLILECGVPAKRSDFCFAERIWLAGFGLPFGLRRPGPGDYSQKGPWIKMETIYAKIDAQDPDRKLIAQAAALLRAGETVAFPTETVYGLGANALDAQACKKIFSAKGRPGDNPLIVHVTGKKQAASVAELSPLAEKLMAKYWPGPLSLVLPKKNCIPREVTAGLDTVAVRCPDHAVAQALLVASGLPVAAPSANLSGKPSPTWGEHVFADLKGKTAMILDAGPVAIGLESTVLLVREGDCVLLRPGGIGKEELETVCGPIRLPQPKDKDRPAAPGMKYKHYAPKGTVTVAAGAEEIQALYEEGQRRKDKIAVLLSEEMAARFPAWQADIIVLGSEKNLATVAQALFAALRACDDREAAWIIAQRFPAIGIGEAIMNRLNKAAGKK